MFQKISFVMLTMVASMGVAAAQAPKTTTPAPTTPAPKTPAPTPPATATPPPPAMAMPTPPAELVAMAKSTAGSWKCTGTSPDPANPTATMKLTGTMKSKIDFDKWWIVDELNLKAGKQPFKMLTFTTFDAKANKWRRIAIDNGGGQITGTSDGVKDNKMTFNMDAMGPMGGGMMRDYADLTDAKAPKFWGELSMDKGKTWMKVYDMSCKR